MAQVQTTADKFKNLIKEILETISSLISDANDAKLTEMLPNQVDVAISLMGFKTSEEMIKSFLKNNNLWPSIMKRNLDFFINDLPVVFKDTGFDTNVLIEPAVIYKHLLANGLGKSKSMNQKKWPISDEDINSLWDRFDLLIKGSLVYNRNNKYPYAIDVVYYKHYNIPQ